MKKEEVVKITSWSRVKQQVNDNKIRINIASPKIFLFLFFFATIVAVMEKVVDVFIEREAIRREIVGVYMYD